MDILTRHRRIARPSSNVRRLRREGSLSVTMASRRRRPLERTHRSRVKRAQPARGGSPYEHMAARQIQTKVRILLPTPIRNFSVISKTCFTSLVNDTVMTDVDGATYFLRAEGRPVGYVPRTEFIRLGVDVVLKSVRNTESAERLHVRSIHSGWPASDGVRVSSE